MASSMRAPTSWRIICAALGVGPEMVVGLCVERSLEMLVGLLGILKAGGAYLPLDPDYPRERLAFMLADAGAPVLVTHSALLRRGCPAHGARSCCLDADGPAIARQPATAPARGLDPQNPAYVIYTSGSTGTPKGVMVAHSGIPNLAATQIDRFAITSEARVLQFASLSFDAALSEIAAALAAGAALVLTAAGSVTAMLGEAHSGAGCHACDVTAGAAGRLARGPAAADVDRRRGGMSSGRGGALVTGTADDQCLWPDRNDSLRDHE